MMDLEHYRLHVAELQKRVEELQAELNTIMTWERNKSASARARKISVELGKMFKEFRKISIMYSKHDKCGQ